MAEFVDNYYVNMSTGMISFVANYGFYLCTSIESSKAYGDTKQKAELFAVDKTVIKQEKMLFFLKDLLVWVQNKQTRHANHHRQPHLKYKIGNIIYVDTRHFALEQENRLLETKNAGRWKIVKNIDIKAYKLEILQNMKDKRLTLIFHL